MGKDVVESLKSVKKKVQFILQEYPETRNNDNLLCSIYWREIDHVYDLDRLKYATSAEAIRRSRQLINSEGKLLATDPEVLRRRRQLAKQMSTGLAKI